MNVLEIGMGLCPAKKEAGDIFRQPDVQYFGADLEPSALRGVACVAADAALLPFRDESMDLVMMRSVFGQFPEKNSEMLKLFGEDPRSVIKFTVYGLAEIFRVLKAGGELVVSEENTPMSVGAVASYVEQAGLTIKDVTRESDESYPALRKKFYTFELIRGPEEPYILRAAKFSSNSQNIFRPNNWVTEADQHARLQRLFDSPISITRHIIGILDK